MHEGAVVRRVVLLAEARRAVVAPAGCNRRVVEGIDGGAVGTDERDVRAACDGGLTLGDPELRLLAGLPKPAAFHSSNASTTS